MYNTVHFEILWVKYYFPHCLKMVKVIFDKTACGETDENTKRVAYSKTFVFCRVKICEKDNQYLQFALNAFYEDVHE